MVHTGTTYVLRHQTRAHIAAMARPREGVFIVTVRRDGAGAEAREGGNGVPDGLPCP